MINKIEIFTISLIYVFFSGIIVRTFPQIPEELSIEWIYSQERRQLEKVPDYFWTNDKWAIIFDQSITGQSHTYERFDPSTLTRIPILDMSAALKSLSSYLKKEEITGRLPWPISFDPLGNRAVFAFQGDIFLLDLRTARFTRITQSTETDTCVRFSPDGEKLTFVRHNDIFVYHIDSGREVRLTFDGSKDILNGRLSWVYWEEIFGHHDRAYWWSHDSRSIVFLQTDESKLGTMYYMDFKPQFPSVKTQKYPKAGQPNPRARLGIITLGDSEITWIQIDPNTYEYLIRVNWLPDDRRICVQTLDRSQTRLDIFLVDRESGKARFLMREQDPAWVDIHEDLIFLKNQPGFLWTSERSGYNHLYWFDMKGELIQPITSGDWALFSSSGVSWISKAVMGIDEENGWIYFTALEKSSIERHLYRIRLDGTGMERLSREAGVHKISFNSDHQYYFDVYSRASSLPVLRLHKSDGEELYSFKKPLEELNKKTGIQLREFFTIPAGDGFEMQAYILKPKDFNPETEYPVIINVYGGPASPKVVDEWKTALFFDNILVNHGYMVFCVDNRSASGISKALRRTTLKQLWGDVELNDLLDAVKWLKKQTFVDGDRIGIWGHSGGGMYTLLAMTRSGEFKAGIAVSPVSDWLYYDTRYTEFAMKTPQENSEGYEKTSLVKRAANLHGRLLLIHGTYDDNVHIQNTWAFANELIKLNIQFDMMIYPMRKHSISDRAARIHMYSKMLEFWRTNL